MHTRAIHATVTCLFYLDIPAVVSSGIWYYTEYYCLGEAILLVALTALLVLEMPA